MRRGYTRRERTATARDGVGFHARLAARHAERLYPGALGRLVAHELVVFAEAAPRGRAGLVESVITEVLDRTPPRAAG
jgi:hypothetical protein